MKEETRQDLLTLVAFAIQKSKTEGDNDAVAEFQQAVAAFDFKKPVTDDDMIDSSFDVLHDFTALTKWPGDDKIVNSLEMTYRTAKQLEQITQDTEGGGGFFKGLIDRLKNRLKR